MKLSRYAVKNALRAEKHRVSSRHGISVAALDREFSNWLSRELMQVGRATPQSRDETMRAELEWLRSFDKRLSRPPDQFCAWFNPKAPADASSPYDFPEVYVWRQGDGVPKKVRPQTLRLANVANLYWRPVFSDEPDLSRPN